MSTEPAVSLVWSYERALLRQIKFEERPCWMQSFDDRTPADLLYTIEQHNTKLKQLLTVEDPEFKDAIEATLLTEFVQDILRTESAVVDVVVANTLLMVSKNEEEAAAADSSSSSSSSTDHMIEKLYIKTINLSFAATWIRALPLNTSLTLSLVLDTHRAVLQNGLAPEDELGTFRSKNVKPVQTTTTAYADSTQIQRKLERLLRFVNSEATISNNSLEDTIRLAAYFISEFLLIHPFMNGNGRVCRLLLQVLMRKFEFVVIIPFSLCLNNNAAVGGGGRELYIRALEERGTGSAPSTLATLLLHCMHQQAHRLHVGFL